MSANPTDPSDNPYGTASRLLFGSSRAGEAGEKKDWFGKDYAPVPTGMGAGSSSLAPASSSKSGDEHSYNFKHRGSSYNLVITTTKDMYVLRETVKKGKRKLIRYFARLSNLGKKLEFCLESDFKKKIISIRRSSLPQAAQEAIARLLKALAEADMTEEADTISVAPRKPVYGTYRGTADEVEKKLKALVSEDSRPSLWQSFKDQPLKTLFYILPGRILSWLAFICTLGYWKPSSP